MRKKKIVSIINNLEQRIKALEIDRIKVQFPSVSTKRVYSERDWEQINRSIKELKKSVGMN
ncbi:hypothetical protein LCGC14_0976240 [marine sediment metagenome]|uniref:Uncharacterized protein n=1 Tax=marine sediment metagenome TaxID=412755 RepID=A0A0F9QTI1_9ZZZZ